MDTLGTLFFTALALGVGGSLHCLGMCGPIALSLPNTATSKFSFVFGRVLYNLGRTVTYALLGAVCGAIGQPIALVFEQQAVSIAIGVVILVVVAMNTRLISGHFKPQMFTVMKGKLMTLWSRFMRRDSKGSMFTVGALNGLLPCGLVYFALAGAIASGSILYGAVYMALFGFGTIPMMLATSLVGPMLGYSLSRFLRPLIPVVIVTVGCLFILRGLNLGIPYVSPKVSHSATTAESGSCCHVK